MTHTFKLARRTARLRGLLVVLFGLGLAACEKSDNLLSNTPVEPETPGAEAAPAVPTDELADQALEDSLAVEDSIATASGDPTGGIPIDEGDDLGEGDLDEEELTDIDILELPAATGGAARSLSLASAYRGGIPFGTYHLPKDQYGKYSGSLANVSPNAIVSYLETARRKGTRVMVSLAGAQKHYKRNGAFSLTMWKARVARYRGVNLGPYIKDGTIIGHYMLDEPHDKGNWRGQVVSRATVDEMAKYSKQLWPGMATVVRSWPAYLRGYRYRYLDAAWAQYSRNYGASAQRLPIQQFVAKNVADARAAGLGLVFGFNLLAGGGSRGLTGYYRGQRAATASELREWGSVMLNNAYGCAFLSWKYDSRYMGRSDIKSALAYLQGKARSRGNKSCRG